MTKPDLLASLGRESVPTVPGSRISFDTVRDIGLAFPGVEESKAYGMPALKVRGKLLASIPANRSVEPDSLVVRIGFEDRAELLAADPAVYYLTDHYDGYDAVLVRLSHATPGVLRDLLGMSYKYVTRASRSPSASKRKRR